LSMALIGLLAYKTMKGKNFSDLFGHGSNAPNSGSSAAGLGGLAGTLGGLLSGGALSGGLHDLLNQFQASGQGDKAQSWVSTQPNKAVSPAELEEALGHERVNWLVQQTGMTKDELLKGLSEQLPQVVDKLTPDGRVPSEKEAQQIMA
jgi:uncharacterized protein YidB (DUF937 family)